MRLNYRYKRLLMFLVKLKVCNGRLVSWHDAVSIHDYANLQDYKNNSRFIVYSVDADSVVPKGLSKGATE